MPTDYYSILIHAIENAQNRSLETRRQIYGRAQELAQSHWNTAQLSNDRIETENAALEEAIQRVELEIGLTEPGLTDKNTKSRNIKIAVGAALVIGLVSAVGFLVDFHRDAKARCEREFTSKMESNDLPAGSGREGYVIWCMAQQGVSEEDSALEKTSAPSIAQNGSSPAVPSEFNGKAALSAYLLGNLKNVAFHIESFTKTDGLAQNFAGQDFYTMSFVALIRFPQDANRDCIPLPPGTFDTRDCFLPNRIFVKAGDTRKLEGTIQFSKSEIGWSSRQTLLSQPIH